MKRYTNKSPSLKAVYFHDGSAAFLKRGQKIDREENEVRVFDKGIEVTDVPVKTTAKSKTKSDSTKSDDQ